MQRPEMTDEEARQQALRTDRFIAEFRARSGLERIAATVNTVDYVLFANLANINTAMRGGLMSLIEVKLMCVGGGPTLDYADAVAFFAEFEPIIEAARKRYLH